jgi:hypothetical protein
MSDANRNKADPEQPPKLQWWRQLEWWQKGLLVLLGLVLALFLSFVGFLVVFVTHYGDPAPRKYMPVINATQEPITVFALSDWPGAEEVADLEIPPGGTSYTSGPCDYEELIARDRHGHEIARHEPTRVCDPDLWVPWIIISE